jgi:hypothetical protein
MLETHGFGNPRTAGTMQIIPSPVAKPVPVTVSVNAALPAVTLDGFSAVIVGTGLGTWLAATVTVAPVRRCQTDCGRPCVSLMYFQFECNPSGCVAGQ